MPSLIIAAVAAATKKVRPNRIHGCLSWLEHLFMCTDYVEVEKKKETIY